MELKPLYTLTGSTVVEKLGKVQDGERVKIEFRGATADDSPIAGKAHGSTWILIGPQGPGETSAVQEIVTAAGERLVVELRGYAVDLGGNGMEIRAAGIIRSSAAAFSDLNGHVALMLQRCGAGGAATVHAYHF